MNTRQAGWGDKAQGANIRLIDKSNWLILEYWRIGVLGTILNFEL
jgi:hypothetical protein